MNIGIDLGGSHIGVGLIDKGTVVSKREIDININEIDIKEFIVRNICNFISEILKEKELDLDDIEFIGISTPGVAKDNVIYNMVNLGINEFKIAEMINKTFTKNIKLKNDAKCAAIAEFKYGCMKDYSDGIFLTMGTGIGGAAFINNRLIQSNTFPGTEFGHMVIQKDGKKCKCGNSGCFETYGAMTVLKQEIKNQYNLEDDISSKEIIDIIKDDIEKEKMSKIIDEYVSYIALGIANLINIFEPEVIGLGGSIVYIGDIITKKLENERIQKNLLFNKRNTINIQIATLGNDAGMIGAANL